MTAPHVLIVGASLAGVRTATALRREGFAGALTVIGDEPWMPYDRPPLSKQVLVGSLEVDALDLIKSEARTELDVTFVLGTAAVSLDVTNRTVTVATGDVFRGDVVVLATGTRARQLPFAAADALHTVRTRDDATTLVAALTQLPAEAPVAVIGGGFIGAEVATATTKRGFRTTVFEAASMPLVGVLGPEVAQWLAPLPSAYGVTLETGITLHDVVTSSEGLAITSDRGSFDAALGVLGVGALPNIEWLASSGLTLDRGVVVDDTLCAAPGIYAVGDVARFPYTRAGRTDAVRIEHWQVANDHASYVARAIVQGATTPFDTVPYFWSDQYGAKIQMLGHPDPTDEVTLTLGSVDERKWLATYHRNGAVTGIVALNNPRELMLAKAQFDR
jgi:3-phenylpropionate/trans-cinnamate dioxygenase ferredoxin reductase component